MLKMAIISSSALARDGRWDAGFHLLQKTHEDMIGQIEQSMTRERALETAREMFEATPAVHRRILTPLLRGRDVKSPSNDALLKAAEEYPYIAIAAFVAARKEIKATIEQQIKDAEAAKDKLAANLDVLDQIQG